MCLNTVLLCATVALVAYCEGATLRDELRPVVETDLELTAADSDTGNWTANLGDMEVKIEHRHEYSSPKENGSWTLDIARTSYEKEGVITDPDNTGIPAEIFVTISEIPEGTSEKSLEDLAGETRNENSELNNEVSVDLSKEDVAKGFVPQEPTYGSFGDYFKLYAPPERHFASPSLVTPSADYYGEENYDSDEVILDPDNFEYFKGVGWFRLDDRHLDWSNARDACAEVGAHLAVPDTPDRVNVFLRLFKRHPDIPANAILRQQVYVGVSDPAQNREFTTVQGKPFAPDFPIWFSKEPDNSPPGEYCVTFHIEGRTRDVPCFYALPFFCEKDLAVVI